MAAILQAEIFKNKTTLITGAASGIGRGLALHAAKLQMNVVLMDLNEGGLNETHSLMSDCPSMVIQCDVSNLEDFTKAKEKIEDELIQTLRSKSYSLAFIIGVIYIMLSLFLFGF